MTPREQPLWQVLGVSPMLGAPPAVTFIGWGPVSEEDRALGAEAMRVVREDSAESD